MAKIFITGSTDGIGFLAAEQMILDGHQVYLHARNASRSIDVKSKLSDAEGVLEADLCNIDQVKRLAKQLNELGKFDAIIHNAGVLTMPSRNLFNVNVLAPYILTCLVKKPQRLIYLSSSMHSGGKVLQNETDINNIGYSDSKLHVTMLMKAVARMCPGVHANAVDPGWVPTKMGGGDATDNLQAGYETQVWLATSDDREALVSGRLFHHKEAQAPKKEVNEVVLQEQLLEICGKLSEVNWH
ncbi:SDR family NAD(P)-dependent oxidoreductase [Fulvivirga maritima]|uniref:SDR family NAD(P)-dependent oxidoreductase n=1 Tax=Fulvivirga maritima TaxID=2904247 RepID=UPI001F4047ED|nr:SDR family NAD(P)-dependent oxidoreductase [Fulvivirga maritima]UII26031.1 SDR family NAD(P)-dependent oxidoreductase [Fulvivirga maritima]